jgi:integrase
MGRKSTTGGVTIKDRNRIQFDFKFDGVRYRPTLLKTPTEANLRRAREHLAAIKQRIAAGLFRFEEEFPDYRHLRKAVGGSGVRTCSQVFDEYIAHCEARLAKNDMAAATLTSYRKILDSIWRPRIGAITFLDIRYSTLVKIADSNKGWSRKTYNNTISVLRRAFVFGYRDHPRCLNPACSLKSSRMSRKDRQTIDPFRIQDAETLLAAIRRDWGEAQGNYDEFRFFTGMRPSEQIALTVRDFNIGHGTLNVSKARVAGIDKDCTKTREDRLIILCPRAMGVLNRQLRLRERLQLAGMIDHDQLFFQKNGAPIRSLLYPASRWRRTLRRLPIRYRKPYTARHTSVSWNLMIGKNPLQVAKQHGHSVSTMFRVYSAWMQGAVESDIDAIKRAMRLDSAPIQASTKPTAAAQKSKRVDSTLIRKTSRPSDEEEVATYSAFGTSKEVPQPKSLTCNKKKWRRGWDSNPRAGITRPSDFESAPL